MAVLLIEVNLLEPVWHGVGDWPPAPFRLFQALVAGAYGGRWIAEDAQPAARRAEALQWLERQEPPRIAAPERKPCREITSFVPNNDLDAVGGDPRRVSDIRAEKNMTAWRLENGQGFLYAWDFEDGAEHATTICGLSERLYRLGRGVDGAWARAAIFRPDDAERILEQRGGVSRPASAGGSGGVPCPVPGSLKSLLRRHEAGSLKFSREAGSKRILFRQPPKAVYRTVSYNCPAAVRYFEIRHSDDTERFFPVPQTEVSKLTESLRDAAARRLSSAMPNWEATVERFLIGRTAGPDDIFRRIRIIPLPSIGHGQTSPSIRRIAVEVPPSCPIRARDADWAFAGLGVPDRAAVLVQTPSKEMAQHYGFGESAKRWRSVTPVALPQKVLSGRTGSDRAYVEAREAAALVQACRHEDIPARPVAIRIQKEPFLQRGELAGAYATAERFDGRLRHIDVTFNRPVPGPLVLGDGRFLGLGLMSPVSEKYPGIHVFEVKGVRPVPETRFEPLVRAFRRAMMARAQHEAGPNKPLPILFHGHTSDGSAARGGSHEHLFYAAYSTKDVGGIDRLAVIAPSFCDRNCTGTRDWGTLARAASDFRSLLCGALGEFVLGPAAPDPQVFGLGQRWGTLTPYRVTRHPKSNRGRADFVADDLRSECSRRAIPIPTTVEVSELIEGRGGSLSAHLVVTFRSRVRGPLLLGRGSHFGDGLFSTGRPKGVE